MGNRLSFALTASEQQRVKMAQALDMHLDPRGAADWIMIIVITIVYSIDVLAVLFMLWNRTYSPIKCKSPILMSCMIVSGILWFAGDIQTNGHAPLEHTALTNCKAFGVWVRILLGVCTLSALIAMRAYGLFRVFCKNRPFRGWGLYRPYAVFCLCMVVYGIVSQVVSPSVTIHYMAVVDICYYESGFKASLFALVWVTWLIVAFLSWRIRNIKSSFNEARESLVACSAVFAVLIFTTVMHYTSPLFPLNVRLRILTTSFDHLATNVFWWSVMAVPLFNCLVRRDRYLAEWTAKLRADGLQRMYDVPSPEGTNAKGSSVYHRNSLFTADYARLDSEKAEPADKQHHTYNWYDGYPAAPTPSPMDKIFPPMQSPMDNGYPYFEPMFDNYKFESPRIETVSFPSDPAPVQQSKKKTKKKHVDLW
ncbi:hypothetical protein IWW50_005134 [Coemansia erecta]|nr:hypothetical protein GGF43_001402 [Coemansia sp. RSA 2618]KAJ2820237.1 hypothetical protein IWW50_005134 [Coemansia erecta]